MLNNQFAIISTNKNPLPKPCWQRSTTPFAVNVPHSGIVSNRFIRILVTYLVQFRGEQKRKQGATRKHRLTPRLI